MKSLMKPNGSGIFNTKLNKVRIKFRCAPCKVRFVQKARVPKLWNSTIEELNINPICPACGINEGKFISIIEQD